MAKRRPKYKSEREHLEDARMELARNAGLHQRLCEVLGVVPDVTKDENAVERLIQYCNKRKESDEKNVV